LVVARAVLCASSDKGEFIEEYIATPAWSPVLSIESTGGATWAELRANFALVHAHLPPTLLLSEEIRAQVAAWCKQTDTSIVDANVIATLVLRAMVMWLFDVCVSDAEERMIVHATWEWRREIAMKGPMRRELKEAVVAWMVNLLRESKLFAHLPFLNQRSVQDPLVFSVFLQPFILSPMINVGDVAVAWYNNAKIPPNEASLRKCIASSHPFPIIERWVERDILDPADSSRVLVPARTQVFIPLDEMGTLASAGAAASWMPFGVGARGCAGQDIALKLMLALFTSLNESGRAIVPAKNHRYSGRNNDNSPFSVWVFLYQLWVFIAVCWRMLLKRLRRIVYKKAP